MNPNMNNNNGDMQRRILIMTVLVFAFFIAYEFLVIRPQQDAYQKEQVVNEVKNTTNNSAPVVQTQATNSAIQAPSGNVENQNIISVIKTNKNKYEIDSLGRILQVTMEDEKYIDEEGNKIKLLDVNQLRPLEVRFADANLNNEAFKTTVISSAAQIDAAQEKQILTLTQELTNTTLTKTITFYPDGHYDLSVKTSTPQTFFISTGFRPDVLADMYADHGALLMLGDGSLTTLLDGEVEKSYNFTDVEFASAFDRYYTSLFYNFDKKMAISIMKDSKETPLIFVQANGELNLSGYVGPKEYSLLESLNPKLTDVIEYGFFTFLAKPMFLFLAFLQEYIGNWGWSIVVLTLVIKLILYPLTYKGMVSMQKLKELAPKIKDLQVKHKDDKQKQSIAMMELYKKHGANPMGGCLPILLQIPVFFAVYRVLLNAIELKGAEWLLWINDLAEMDPYFVLPILMGASMYIQQKITPNTMQDEMQKKIFQFLPIVFTFFFLWFPAGLTLYWFANNVFTIMQQYYMNKVFEKQKAIK